MAALCLQETPLQQGLHVTAAVGNHQHIDFFSHDPVNDAVGLSDVRLGFCNEIYGKKIVQRAEFS